MAKGRKVKAAVAGGSDYDGCTLVNVLRIPRISGGTWEKSNRGSLLLDTLCFPITTAVEVVKKSKMDHAAWVVKVDGKEMPAEQARPLSIGDSVLTDTTTGKRYLVRNAAGDDAMPEHIKREIIRKSKRRTAIRRVTLVCKLLDSVASMPGLGDCFTDEERAEMFNKPAHYLNEVKATLFKVAKAKQATQYLALQ